MTIADLDSAAVGKANASSSTAVLDRVIPALLAAREEVGKVVIGQRDVVDQLLIGLICGGHVLLEGPPGVGKTLMVRTLATVAGLSFGRVQFTPDLMPADVTGSLVLVPDSSGRMTTRFEPGPIFTNILLADEINRATPRTQSSLLEAMQERTVTAAGRTLDLPQPFVVLATQNPIESEGTYDLPEAQIDRFMFKSLVRYPQEDELDTILGLTVGAAAPAIEARLSTDDILAAQRLTREVPVAAHVRRAVVLFSLASQPDKADSPEDVRRFFRFGLSPRGAQSLILGAKGRALLEGRFNVSFDDLRQLLLPAMRHRIQLNFEGEAEGADLDKLLRRLFEAAVRAVL